MIRVRIPATSANLGPGFDCMGMALGLWNTFELHAQTDVPGVRVESHGEGAAGLPTDHTNMIAQTMLAELARLEELRGQINSAQMPRSFRIICHNDIPCASGMGSSSTAVLAGLIFAHGLVFGCVDIKTVLDRATALEGHGDNVAPALYGGLILISYDGEIVVAERVTLPPLRVVVCVPTFNFLTSEARAALPRVLSRADAVFNIGRAMLVAEALRNGDDDLLARAMGDRIHEPYRIPLIPGAAHARQAALSHGAIAVSLSGAGPGLLAYARERHEAIGQAMQDAFHHAGLSARYWVLDASPQGAEISIEM